MSNRDNGHHQYPYLMTGGKRQKHPGTSSDSDEDFDPDVSPIARRGGGGKRGQGGDFSQPPRVVLAWGVARAKERPFHHGSLPLVRRRKSQRRHKRKSRMLAPQVSEDFRIHVPQSRDEMKEYKHTNPWTQPKHPGISDIRFWDLTQVSWYQNILKKTTHRVVLMKCIDWQRMETANDPTFELIQAECDRRNLTAIMGMHQHWNDEIIAQFYSTLWVEQDEKNQLDYKMHWTIEGNRFSITYFNFAHILGFDDSDNAKLKATVFDPQEDSDWGFMYDARYVDPKHGVEYGSYHGMKPYFWVLNNMLRVTLTPNVGDHTHILSSTKTLMFAMKEEAEPFSVFEFMWTEILYNSYTSKASLIYAPYIIKMILHVVGYQFIYDHKHPSVTPKKFPLIASPPHGGTPPAAYVPQSSAAVGEAAGTSAVPPPHRWSSKVSRAISHDRRTHNKQDSKKSNAYRFKKCFAASSHEATARRPDDVFEFEFSFRFQAPASCFGSSPPGAVSHGHRGVESFDIDMKEQKVTVKGNVKPEAVFQTVSKTGKKTSFWEEPAAPAAPAPAAEAAAPSAEAAPTTVAAEAAPTIAEAPAAATEPEITPAKADA
ncbi:hypothetical protein PR202_ga01582 [Eleusine coracana subsp. coracana]|uniref:Uncharacterized protein n=1 Tax=Eleusine coracana subsp. coracana TaxID=191504 RepID=A0AAV5BFH8_ELECO|nr:hypothetical protein PR202_ga00895 [Eleusine coracana subsp. coracana]GJM85783.1 hypothetical protein PR202_ga01582 [Eleusine coracana subsp. coracana]